MLIGCGSSKPGGKAPPDLAALARQKVQAVQKMADGVNDPSGVPVLGAFDEFSNIPFEPKDHPAEARQILEIYNTKLRGKLKGEVATQMQGEMARYQAAVAGSK
jgi:hypothetical protein